MNLCVVGTGYVGLVNGAGFAETGHTVVCADVDQEKILSLQAGEIPIFEPGLPALVARNRSSGRLRFTNDVEAAVSDADVIFIAVGTPPRGDGGADLSAVDSVATLVSERATRECILILKSTVPVGTNDRARRLVDNAAQRVHVVSNPEFLKEGSAVADFLRPDRIVIGVLPGDDFARKVMTRLYHPLLLNKDRVVWMRPESAELTKYVANTMLAMRISFMNEVAMLCEQVGADCHEVRHGVGSDVRIGSQFLYAGPGYGGSCFPKDVKALVHTGRDHGLELELASTTDRVNDRHKGVLMRKLRAQLGGDVRGRRVAIWGLAFKPKTDDLRESPALTLIDALLADGAEVVAHDPEAGDAARAHYGDRVHIAESAYAAAEEADALVLVTEWREYQNPDFGRILQALRNPVLLDGRNLWTTYGLCELGFTYEGVGTAVS
ncbi:MAG: UDP-glucose/GDP-mannose dehydrogenase family protein [Deltaproteobacteria bacterium]|nr:UDP-glucose/GDP-mannose dehydrogenase family protein [Deltaproteobacteria bacterium]